MEDIQVISFYKFSVLDDQRIDLAESTLHKLESDLGLRGLFILSHEGVNATASIHKDQSDTLKSELTALLDIGPLSFKDSFTDKHPFHKLSVKRRAEIVTLNRTDLVPTEKHHHLSPKEWDKALKEDNVLVIDTRNSYEYKLGHFRSAVDPETEEFTEFPNWVKDAEIPKDKKILIYCTGGIRCEKAILEMEEQGYQNVYQLDGGILNYLNEFPNKEFEGECFVFDYRVAVDQNLAPSKTYRLCPHCGQPGKTKIECIQCHIPSINCDECLEKEPQYHTCSKNCAHHYRMGHNTRRIHKDAFVKRGFIEESTRTTY